MREWNVVEKKFFYGLTIILTAVLVTLSLVHHHLDKKAEVYAPVNDGYVTMYSSDGRLCRVYPSEVENYKSVGWYDKIEDAATLKYTDSGECIVVFKDDADSFFKADGKWKDLYDASTLMYDANGDNTRVFLADVDEYLQKGYFKAPQTLDPNMPMIAITFDDGPSEQQTPRLLDICEKYGAHVTFFVLGSRAEGNKDILSRAVQIGCEVGSHTYSHKQLTNLAPDVLDNEISSTRDIITEATGKPPRALRPPYGAYNATVSEKAKAGITLWSVDTQDWKSGNADKIVEHVLSHAHDGDIVLLHDIYAASVDAADRFIPALQSRGYTLVTVEELITSRRGSMENGTAYYSVPNK